MSRLTLHRALASPPARAVLILADILELKVEVKDVNLLKLEHKSPEFLKINPMGTVPTLEDGDFVVSESHAILKYLLQSYGGEHRERLYPTEAKAQAIVDQCLFFNAGVFFTALKPIGLETFLSNLEEPTPKQKAGIENAYSVVDAYLQSRRYIAADHLTLADLAAGCTATAMQPILPVDKDRFPKCADWISRLEEEPYFKKHEEGVKQFGKLIHLYWEKNKQKNRK